ncbi:MAG: glycosyltransferase, partial [Bdellovibrionales bacterium]|nr:glycosyltransferase [Bdellovibrionales bacterium]
MKVALVHDWLNGMRGGERCLEAFLDLYPQADIHCLFHVPGATSSRIDSRVKSCSFLQRVPGVRRFYRFMLPLYPWAARSLDLSAYDLVISLSHAAAKNVRVGKHSYHIVYCFSPMRYIWDQAESYFGKFRIALWPVIRALRRWDRAGAKRPDLLIAISDFVAARIRCYYGRRAAVVYPPVRTEWISSCQDNQPGKAFLYAGALVPYKRPDLVLDVCARMDLPLWIAGSGPLETKLRERAGANVKFWGRVPDSQLANLYRSCRALIFPGVEDFGLVPIECLAAGRPVIGYAEGALRETIQGVRHWNHEALCEAGGPQNSATSNVAPDGASGVFIKRQRMGGNETLRASLEEALRYFLSWEESFLSRN